MCYLENDIFVIFKLDHHVSCLPVDIPGLHSGISPCLQMISFRKCHPHNPVGAYSKQFVFLLAMEPHHEQTDSVFRQRLPSTNEIHFWFQQIEILDIGVRLEDLLTQLARVPFPGEAGRHIVLRCYLDGVGVYGRGRGWGLHAQERLDGVNLGVISRVSQGLSLGGESAGSEPLSILILLKHKQWELLSDAARKRDREVCTYRNKSKEHLCHSLSGRHFQFDFELVSRQVECGGHLAALQMDREKKFSIFTGRVGALVRQKAQILAHKIKPLVGL